MKNNYVGKNAKTIIWHPRRIDMRTEGGFDKRHIFVMYLLISVTLSLPTRDFVSLALYRLFGSVSNCIYLYYASFILM